MTTPTHLLWLDLETTQTDAAHPTAAILEIGAIITTWSPELVEVGRASLLVRPDGGPDQHQRIWGDMHPVVQEMHTNNGLWADVTNNGGDVEPWGLLEADAAIASWLREHVDSPVPIAGSGVSHLDAPFVARHMPHLATAVTYWTLDTGHLRRSLQLAGAEHLVNLEADVYAKPHRGLADIELHVAEARRYLTALATIPGAPAADDPAAGTFPPTHLTEAEKAAGLDGK